MRDSNYKSISLNRAAVSISTNLYDRRALDSTSDRPLVNSLNHLTFLTSSSAKVRETLSTDGGLERLVGILHECKKKPDNVVGEKKKTIAQEKNDAIIAWKWTLAFQCLVLIGTRGTESIRKRVVEAGIIPIIATVLDNYLLIVRNFDNNIDNNLNDNFLNLVNLQQKQSILQQQQDSLSKENYDDYDAEIKNYLNSNSELFNYLHEDYNTPPSTSSSSSQEEANNTTNSPIQVLRNINNEINIQQNLQDINQTINSPRFFLNGILIPKEDDVVWSLQLLAFISKYSNLKDFLQFTNLVDPLSLRSLLNKNNSSNQQNCSIPPPLENDDLDNELEYELISNLSSDENDKNNHQNQQQQQQQQQQPSNTQSTIEDSSQSQPQTQRPSSQSSTSQILIQNNNESNDNIITDNDELINSNNEKPDLSTLVSLYSQSNSINNSNKNLNNLNNINNNNVNDQLIEKKQSCFTKSLLNSFIKFAHCCEKESPPPSPHPSNEAKTLSLIELTIKLNKFYQRKHSLNKLTKIQSNIKKREQYQSKWNYNSYFQKNPSSSSDIDSSLKITHHLNIFPLVEKFTIKSINSPDMCYWSGVIMRNSCRKDESRGGVRQCASFDCGKWEEFPRQFAKCRRCKRTKYCSKNCQLKAWVYHKHWCVDSNSSSSGMSSGRIQNSQRQEENEGAGGAGATTQLNENLNL